METLEGKNSEGMDEKQEERQECDPSVESVVPKTEQKKRKPGKGTESSELSNGGDEKFEISTDEEEEPTKKRYKLKDNITSELAVQGEMETTRETQNSEEMEEDQEMEQDCQGTASDESDTALKTEGEGTESADTQVKSKKKRMSGAQKRKMRIMMALLAGERVLTKAERRKRKPEASTQKSDNSNEVAKTSKPSTDGGEALAKQKPKGKEVKSSDTVNADDSDSMIQAVVPEGFPDVKMTEEQAEMLGSALVERINPSDKGEPIQFTTMEYKNGGVAFTCANKTTKVWLYSTIPKIDPWPKARLTVGPVETTLKGTKFILWVIKGMNNRSNQQILDFLQKQNKDISTAEWKIIRRVVETDRRVQLTVWVDDKSSEDLKAHNFKLFLGIYRVRFMSLPEWKKLKSRNNSKKQDAVQSSTGSRRRHSTVSKSSDKNVPNSRVSSSTTDLRDSRTSDRRKLRTSEKEKPRTSNKKPLVSPGRDHRSSPARELRSLSSPGQEPRSSATARERRSPTARERRSSPTRKHRSSPARERRSSPAKEHRSSPAKEHRSSPAKERRSSPAKERRSSPARESRSLSSRGREPRSSTARERRSPPARERQLSPTRKHRSSPGRERRSSPAKERRSSPAKERRSSPAKERRSSHSRERRPSHSRERRPSHSRERRPLTSPGREPLSSPARERRSSPARERRSSPTRERRSSPTRDRRSSPAREHRSSPARERRSSPARKRRSSPARERRSSPARERRSSPARERRSSPARECRSLSSPSRECWVSTGQECRSSLSREQRSSLSRESRASHRRDRRGSRSRERRRSRSRERRRSRSRERRRSRSRERRRSWSRERRRSRSRERRRSRSRESRGSHSRERRGSHSRERRALHSVERECAVPNPPQISGTRYTTSDLASSQNTSYLSPNQDEANNPRVESLGQPPIVSRFRNLSDHPKVSAVLPHTVSPFLTSEQPHDSGFAELELLQSHEVSYIVSDPAHSREPRCISDGSVTNKHFASALRQPHETGYGAPDPPQLLETRHTVLDPTSARNSKYVPPSKERSESPRFRRSGESTPRVSRFSDSAEPLTETVVLQNLASKLVASQQLRERGIVTSELSQLREASSVTLDRLQSRESKHTYSRLQESRYFASDRRQPLETGYGDSDPPLITVPRFTVSDQLSHEDTKLKALSLAQSGDSRYVSPNQDQSKNTKLRTSDQPPSRDSRFRDRGESLKKSAVLKNVESPHVASAQTLEHGLGQLELSEASEAIYMLSDRAQESRKFASDRRQSPETVYEIPDPPQISKSRFTFSDRMSPQKTKYMVTDQAMLCDSKYETPNEDHPKNESVRSAGKPRTRVSRFSAVDETLTVPAVLQNLAAAFLASEQPKKRGFDTSELTHLQEVSYPILYRAKHRDSTYCLDRPHESECITSDRQQPRETGYVDPDSSPLRGLELKASDQALSPMFVTSSRDQSKNPRLRYSDELLSHGSRLRTLDKPPVEESRLRASDQKQSKEGRYMERDPLYSRRISDPQQFRELDKTDSQAPHSRKTRL